MKALSQDMKLALVAVALLIIGSLFACDLDTDFPESIQRTWAAPDASGEQESIRFTDDTVHFSTKAQGEYSCPYRIYSFDEKALTLDINTTCEQRTGSTLPVMYKIELSEDRQNLSLYLQKRKLGVYRASSEG